jgi:hypothetical protein
LFIAPCPENGDSNKKAPAKALSLDALAEQLLT